MKAGHSQEMWVHGSLDKEERGGGSIQEHKSKTNNTNTFNKVPNTNDVTSVFCAL